MEDLYSCIIVFSTRENPEIGIFITKQNGNGYTQFIDIEPYRIILMSDLYAPVIKKYPYLRYVPTKLMTQVEIENCFSCVVDYYSGILYLINKYKTSYYVTHKPFASTRINHRLMQLLTMLLTQQLQ